MRRFLLIAVVGALLGGSVPATASAQAVSCDVNDLDVATFNQPEKETRELRNDVRKLCSVLDQNGDVAASDADRLHADLVLVAEKQDQVLAQLSNLRSDLAAGLDVRPDIGRTSATAVYTESPEALAQANAGFGALHSGLWYLAGVAASMIAAYGVYRQVMPRA